MIIAVIDGMGGGRSSYCSELIAHLAPRIKFGLWGLMLLPPQPWLRLEPIRGLAEKMLLELVSRTDIVLGPLG